ncbi:MAG: alpha/beta hydrolase [Herpetosiphonaceae bacterium]|nr:alpha/beta hydrolase [Herpetosiphonaceae bacterium]
MSVVYLDQEAVHYEVFGHGRPVLFLHGWLGSWRYWLPSIEVVSQTFRTFSFDFSGFGDTTQRHVTPSIPAYADQVTRFLDEMGIDKVRLVGHSMGGMVALKTAIEHADRIERVVTVGAPISGSALSPLLKLAAIPSVAQAMAHWPEVTTFLFKQFLNESRQEDMLEILAASVKPSSDNVRRSVRSMMGTDLRSELGGLQVPTLAIHGTRDDVVSPSQIKVAQQAHSAFLHAMPMAGCRHFPWNDDPERFHALLLAFLET